MTNPAKLLLVVVGETRLHGEIPLFEYVVRRLRQLGLGGATAIRAELGFGHRESLQPGGPFELSADRPVVVFALDEVEKIEGVLPEMRSLVEEGLVAIVEAGRLSRA